MRACVCLTCVLTQTNPLSYSITCGLRGLSGKILIVSEIVKHRDGVGRVGWVVAWRVGGMGLWYGYANVEMEIMYMGNERKK